MVVLLERRGRGEKRKRQQAGSGLEPAIHMAVRWKQRP